MLTFVARGDRRIICGSWASFEEVRAKYFAEIPASEWKLM